MSYWGCTLSFIIPFSQFVLKAPLLWILFDIVLVKFLPGIYSHRFYFPSRAFFLHLLLFQSEHFFFIQKRTSKSDLKYKVHLNTTKVLKTFFDKYHLTNDLVPHLPLSNVLFFDTQRLHMLEEQIHPLLHFLSNKCLFCIFFPFYVCSRFSPYLVIYPKTFFNESNWMQKCFKRKKGM